MGCHAWIWARTWSGAFWCTWCHHVSLLYGICCKHATPFWRYQWHSVPLRYDNFFIDYWIHLTRNQFTKFHKLVKVGFRIITIDSDKLEFLNGEFFTSVSKANSLLLWFFIVTLCNWFKIFKLLFQQTSNHVFPRFEGATYTCFEFWLVHWILGPFWFKSLLTLVIPGNAVRTEPILCVVFSSKRMIPCQSLSMT